MSISRRLERLETQLVGGAGCPACGAAPGDAVRFVVDGAQATPAENVRCDACGRLVRFTITIGELQDAG